MFVSQTAALTWGFGFAVDRKVVPMFKKFALLAVIMAIILFIINRVRNEVIIDTDSDE